MKSKFFIHNPQPKINRLLFVLFLFAILFDVWLHQFFENNMCRFQYSNANLFNSMIFQFSFHLFHSFSFNFFCHNKPNGLILCKQIVACASVLFIMVSVISFCLKTHPGFRVEMTPALHGEFNNNSLNYHSRNAHLSSISMPKTAQTTTPTPFRYVRSASSKSSGNSFSPTSAGSTIADKSTVPTPTIFDTTTQKIQSERMTTRYVHYNSHSRRPYVVSDVYDQPHEAFFYVELLCNLWFIIEFTTRFLVIILFGIPFFTNPFKAFIIYLADECPMANLSAVFHVTFYTTIIIVVGTLSICLESIWLSKQNVNTSTRLNCTCDVKKRSICLLAGISVDLVYF